MLKIFIYNLFFLFFCIQNVFAGQYYYAGITRTGEVTETSADFVVYEHLYCQKTECHSLIWQVLWDTQESNQYVEAGIGYSPRFTKCTGYTSVALWYASPRYPYGESLFCIPKGTKVHISSIKDKYKPYVHITYEFFYKKQQKITVSVYTPQWYNTPGIHPVKVEIYSKYENIFYPINIAVENISLFFPQDQNVILQHTYPYIAQQIDNTYGFVVQYR